MLLPWPLVLGALVAAPLLLATRAVLSPRVLRASDADEEDLGENAHVLLAGSCNPLHSGHVALLRRMAARHPRSRLFCCVAFNPAKRYAVSPQARCELAAAMCAAAGLGERVHCVDGSCTPRVREADVRRFVQETKMSSHQYQFDRVFQAEVAHPTRACRR